MFNILKGIRILTPNINTISHRWLNGRVFCSFLIKKIILSRFDFDSPGCLKCEWTSSVDFPTATVLSEFDE